jgi:hypothetical protein
MRTERVRTRSRAIPETVPDALLRCANPDCGVEFKPVRPWHRYHSTSCRVAHWRRRSNSLSKAAEALAKAGRPWKRQQKSSSEATVAPAKAELPPPRPTRSPKVGLTIQYVIHLSWPDCDKRE